MNNEKYVVCVNWFSISDVGNDIPLSDTSTVLGIMLMSGMNSFRFSNTYRFGTILNKITGQGDMIERTSKQGFKHITASSHGERSGHTDSVAMSACSECMSHSTVG